MGTSKGAGVGIDSWLIHGLHPTLRDETAKGGAPGRCGRRRRKQRQEQRQRFGIEGKASGEFFVCRQCERAGPESASNRD